LVERLAEIGDARHDGRELHEVAGAFCGDESREGRLATPRRTPEQEAGRRLLAEILPEPAPRGEQLLVPHDLVEGPRPHARGEGLWHTAELTATRSCDRNGLRRPPGGRRRSPAGVRRLARRARSGRALPRGRRLPSLVG